MARRRNVSAKREILVSDVNSLTNYLLYDMEVVTGKLVACSSGVVEGFEVTGYSGLNLYIPSGIISDGMGHFLEMLSQQTLASPSASNTYKIYGTSGSTSDEQVSGYVLIDTSTRLESYDVVNARTYDSISFTYTSGTVPANGHYICDAVVSGGSITSVTDQRTFMSLGNLPVYSIQSFSQDGRNIGYRVGKITGYVMDDTDSDHNKFINVSIDNSHAGYGIYVNNGTNSGTSGFVAVANGNVGYYSSVSSSNGIGFKSFVNANSTGFYVDGNSLTNTTGLNILDVNKAIVVTGSNRGFDVTTVASGYGIYITNNNTGTGIYIDGANNADYGIVMDDVKNGIAINSISANDTIGITIATGTGSSYTTNIGVKIQIEEQTRAIYLQSDAGVSTTNVIGIEAEKDVGANNFANFIIATDYETGIKLTGDLSLNEIGIELIDNALGLSITKTTTHTAQPSLKIDNGGVTASYSDGIYINDSYRAISISGCNTGILGASYETGIKLTGDLSANEIGIELIDNALGISISKTTTHSAQPSFKIDNGGKTSSHSDGIYVVDAYRAISVADVYLGLDIANSCTHQIILNPLGSNPASPTAGEIVAVDTGSAIKLRVYNSYTASWQDCN
jgi:hypothetical protein